MDGSPTAPTPTSAAPDLREYEELKFELSAVVRAVGRHLASRGRDDIDALRDLFGRLAEDRFNLAVVGRFSRGKTSLMNAILGMDRLPTGVIPLTSVITLVAYGSEEKAVLHYQGTRLLMDAPLEQLADYITERGNPGNRRGIRVAEVQLPAEFLRRGFTFVDTPGIGSSIVANTRTTESFLPEADALILVTSHDSPLAEEEARLLARALAAGQRVFVAVNKQDIVDEAGRAEGLAHVRRELARLSPDTPVAVFSVSSRDALAAKLARDEAALEASGLPALETALVDFLVHGRHRAFLLGMCDRIEALLAEPAPNEFTERLAALRARIQTTQVRAPSRPLARPAASLPPMLPRCEVCSQLIEATFQFFARYQAELYANRQVQDDLAARGGFCRLHARQFEAIAATREAATGLAPVLVRQANSLRGIVEAEIPPAGAAAMIADLLGGGRGCPACAVARQAEAAELHRLVTLIARDGADIVHARSAFCLPHLGRLVAVVEDREAARALLLRQAELMERLAEDASRYALKHDALRRDAASKEDLAAAARAARVLLEHPNAQYELQCQGETSGVKHAGASPQ